MSIKTKFNFRNLRQHTKNRKATGTSNSKIGKKCPLCDYRGSRTQNFLNHFGEVHQIEIIPQYLEIAALDEFFMWKENIELETKSHFIKETRTVFTAQYKHMKYVCHRSGNYVTKDTGVKQVRTHSSKKINGFCPARINVTVHNDGKCQVFYVDTHVGHDNTVRLPLKCLVKPLSVNKVSTIPDQDSDNNHLNKSDSSDLQTASLQFHDHTVASKSVNEIIEMDPEGDDAMELDETVPNAQLIVNEELNKSLEDIEQQEQNETASDLNVNTPDASVTNDNPAEDTTAKPTNVTDMNEPKDSDTEISANNTDIIDLVARKVVKGNSRCINYACSSGINMMQAPSFCLSYYRVKGSVSKGREICSECFNLAVLYYDKLALALKNNKSLFDIDADTPLRDDLVEIDDSDSDDEKDTEEKIYFDEDAVEFLKNNLDDVLMETLKKVKLDEQIKSGIEHVREKSTKLDSAFQEVDEMFKELRENLDGMQKNLYSQFKTEYKHVKSLDIIDDCSINVTQYKAEIEKREELDRRNLRKIIKPISYSELDEVGTSKISTEKESELVKSLPPAGPVIKPPAKIGEFYYAVRFSSMGSWTKVRLVSTVPPGTIYNNTVANQLMYYVCFESPKQRLQKHVCGKEIAYATPPKNRLEVGARVIAVFKEINSVNDSKKMKKDAFYPGIVAEPLSSYNHYRYLIFFDDGYAQYVNYDSVYLVFEASKNVWEDMHVDSRLFIKKYLEMYPERPMVKLMKDQTVRTEYNGRWWLTTVMKIDCSLVQMCFDSTSRVEWIYRGSTRLNPMFKEEQAATNRLQNKTRQTWKLNNSKNDSPYVQYTRDDTDVQIVPSIQPSSMQSRSVAKKSTAKPFSGSNSNSQQPGGVVPFLPVNNNNQHTVQLPPPSKIVYYTPREQLNTKVVFKPHTCSPKCKEYVTYNLSKLNGYNPLSKPLLCGWNRIITKHKGKKEVVYKTPCSRYIRSMPELHKYLLLTKSDMTVDLFDFDYFVRCLAEYVLEPNTPANKDLTAGVEQVPIPVVNYVDNDKLNFSHYSNKREPKEGVDLNLDSEFLCGCDCEDDCQDKNKCECWQLTLQGKRYIQKDEKGEITGGYAYRRLLEPVITGIYECNSRCKCSKTCLNRVVQNPLSVKLQVFKTNNRGWGIRCLNDIPQGAFVCVYAGALLTEQMANEGGLNYGDEYLAELDYIEAVETYKEDFELDPYDEKDLRDDDTSQNDSGDEDEDEVAEYRRKVPIEELDNDFVPSFVPTDGAEDSRMKLRLRNKRNEEKNRISDLIKEEKIKSRDPDGDTVYISDDDEDPREPSSFNPKTEPSSEDIKSKYKSVRRMFGERECVYIMDAKTKGNIGRFLNHSCSPNIFVQNVFVDTHDLRFPWVAFFSLSYIRAGTELTWNYNYDIGSVPGKVMYCHCASAECKGRLL